MTSRSGARLCRAVTTGTLALTLTLGSAMAQDIRITHPQGETVLPAMPQKVAVLELSALDILDALGVQAIAGVPKPAEGPGNFPPYLTTYNDARYASAGSLVQPDLEALAALAPDLIIIGGRSRGAYAELSAIAPTIDIGVSGDGLLDTVFNKIDLLSAIFETEERGTELKSELEEAVTSLHARAANAGTGVVIFSAGENYNPQLPGARFGTVFDVVGIAPVLDPATLPPAPQPAGQEATEAERQAARDHQVQIADQVFAADPDWIFTIDRSAAFGGAQSTLPERLAADDRVTATTAWANEQVLHLDPVIWYLQGGSGYNAILSTIEAVDAAFTGAGL